MFAAIAVCWVASLLHPAPSAFTPLPKYPSYPNCLRYPSHPHYLRYPSQVHLPPGVTATVTFPIEGVAVRQEPEGVLGEGPFVVEGPATCRWSTCNAPDAFSF